MELCRTDPRSARRWVAAGAEESSTMDDQVQPMSEHDLIDRLVHQSHYTPEELAHVTGIGRHIIQHAVYTGELRSFVVDHHCLDIRREDVLIWLRRNERLTAGT
jgi:hypothetical protein